MNAKAVVTPFPGQCAAHRAERVRDCRVVQDLTSCAGCAPALARLAAEERAAEAARMEALAKDAADHPDDKARADLLAQESAAFARAEAERKAGGL